MTAQDLCGKSVGVVTATVIADIMPHAESDKCKENGKGPITVKEFPTDPEATQALLAHQVDAQMTDGAVAKIAVEKSRNRLVLSSDGIDLSHRRGHRCTARATPQCKMRWPEPLKP